MQIVADDEANTFGNPCPVQDRDTGTIWLPLTHNLGTDSEDAIRKRTAKGTRTVWITKSTDDGATWAKPVEITATTKREDWTWYATGPGCGIQLKSGHLVIPCDHNLAESGKRRSHAI
jgi:sialidase-1